MRKLILNFILLFLILFIALPTAHSQYIKRDLSKIHAGMTTTEVRSAIGTPDHINRSGSETHQEEQWVYREGRHKDLYIYFENGIYIGYYQRTGEKPSRLP